MYPTKSFLLVIAITLVVLAPVLSAQAHEAELAIEVQPQAGPPGTFVTIIGHGAPPNAAVDILMAPFGNPATCKL